MQVRVPLAGLMLAVCACAQTGVIAGRVLEAGTASAVDGARVVLTEDRQGPDALVATAVTDGGGRFVFDRIPAGRWMLVASKPGYMGLPFGSARPWGPGEFLTLGEGERRDALVFRLPKMGWISGRVTDEDGEPLPVANVSLLVERRERGKLRWSMQRQENSDANGRYRIGPLYPGKYKVRASYSTMPATRIRPEVLASAPREQLVLASRYYPDTDQLDRAEILELAPGQDATGVDLRLRFERVISVTVRPILPDDKIPSVVDGTIYSPDSDTTWAVHSRGEPRKLEIPGGLYSLVANAVREGQRLWARQPVDLSGAANEVEIPVTFEAGPDIEGRIRVEGPGAASLTRFTVELTAGEMTASENPKADVVPDAKGELRFKFVNVQPGIWDIGARPIPRGGYLKSMRLGDQDVLTEEMRIDRNSKGPLEIVISTRASVIEGQMRDDPESGKRSRVIVIAPAGRFRHVLSFYRTLQTDAEGRFWVRDLNPGEYTLYAFESIEPQAWQEPSFFKGLEGKGETVVAKEGETVRVRPALIVR